MEVTSEEARNERESIRLFESILKREPNNSAAYFEITKSLIRLGKYKEALKVLDDARKQCPEKSMHDLRFNYNHGFLRGEALEKLGQKEAAAGAFRFAERHAPDNRRKMTAGLRAIIVDPTL